mgnify:CR=1 FL=1
MTDKKKTPAERRCLFFVVPCCMNRYCSCLGKGDISGGSEFAWSGMSVDGMWGRGKQNLPPKRQYRSGASMNKIGVSLASLSL